MPDKHLIFPHPEDAVGHESILHTELFTTEGRLLVANQPVVGVVACHDLRDLHALRAAEQTNG